MARRYRLAHGRLGQTEEVDTQAAARAGGPVMVWAGSRADILLDTFPWHSRYVIITDGPGLGDLIVMDFKGRLRKRYAAGTYTLIHRGERPQISYPD